MPKIDLSYEQWIDYVFDHTDLPSSQAWYFDHAADWWNPRPEQAVAYLARLFDNPEPLLDRFVDNQVARGLRYLIDNSISNHCVALSDNGVPIDQRVKCIYAMLSLFMRILQPRCPPILSHLDESRGNRLNGVCYMWWDIIPLAAMSKPRNPDPIHDACLAVMRSTLALPNPACQESAARPRPLGAHVSGVYGGDHRWLSRRQSEAAAGASALRTGRAFGLHSIDGSNRMMELSGPSQPPAAGGKPRQLVVLLHGYGSNGEDLIGLAPFFAQALPEAEFLSPNAPFPCELSPMGFQWFGLEDRSPEMKLGGVRVAAQILDPFLDAELARRGLADRDLALVGFSQGTMMSLHVGPRRPKPIGGILGFSGALIAPPLLAEETRSKPPVFLVHGTADQVVPFGALAQAEKALRDAGIPVEIESRPGLVHSIDQAGAQKGALFLRRCFGSAPAPQ